MTKKGRQVRAQRTAKTGTSQLGGQKDRIKWSVRVEYKDNADCMMMELWGR